MSDDKHAVKKEAVKQLNNLILANIDGIVNDLFQPLETCSINEVPVKISFTLRKGASRIIDTSKGIKIEWERKVKRMDETEPLFIDLEQGALGI